MREDVSKTMAPHLTILKSHKLFWGHFLHCQRSECGKKEMISIQFYNGRIFSSLAKIKSDIKFFKTTKLIVENKCLLNVTWQ